MIDCMFFAVFSGLSILKTSSRTMRNLSFFMEFRSRSFYEETSAIDQKLYCHRYSNKFILMLLGVTETPDAANPLV